MRSVRLFSTLLLAALAAQASTVTVFFTALPSTLENYNYQTSNASPSATYNGYASATIDGFINQSLICDDYLSDTSMPSSSNLIYDYSTLGGTQPLQYARFTGVNETRNYEEAAVLLVGLSNDIANHVATAKDITDIQYALWNLFDPSLTINSSQQGKQTAALSIVDAGGQSALNDYKQLVIYTPTAAYASNQEFLGLNTPVGAPEPSAAPLLALLFGAGWFAAQRRRSLAWRLLAKPAAVLSSRANKP
jgi:hypothetical protein